MNNSNLYYKKDLDNNSKQIIIEHNIAKLNCKAKLLKQQIEEVECVNKEFEDNKNKYFYFNQFDNNKDNFKNVDIINNTSNSNYIDECTNNIISTENRYINNRNTNDINTNCNKYNSMYKELKYNKNKKNLTYNQLVNNFNELQNENKKLKSTLNKNNTYNNSCIYYNDNNYILDYYDINPGSTRTNQLLDIVDKVVDRSLFIYKNTLNKSHCITCSNLLKQGKSAYLCFKKHKY